MNPKNAVANAKEGEDAAEKWLDIPQVCVSGSSQVEVVSMLAKKIMTTSAK